MNSQDREAVELIWRKVCEDHPHAPPAHLIARMRDLVQDAVERGVLFSSEMFHRLQRSIRGRRGPWPPDVLDVRHQIARSREHRAYVLDVFVTLGDTQRPHCIRVLLDDGGRIERSSLHYEPTRTKSRRIDRLNDDLRAGTMRISDRDKNAMMLELSKAGLLSDDRADAMAYAMEHLTATMKPCAECQCEIASSANRFSIVGRVGGFCQRCWHKAQSACVKCAAPFPPKQEYSWPEDTCPVCRERRASVGIAMAALLSICRQVADAVALRWAAAISTHPVACLRVRPVTRSGYLPMKRVCSRHGVGLAHEQTFATPTGGRVEYTCPDCRARDELLASAVGFITSTMILAAYALWSSIDDGAKRFMLLERYGDEVEPYRPTTEDLARGARDEATIDPSAIHGLLLEMD